MKCPRCSNEIRDNATFCNGCGYRITTVPVVKMPQKKSSASSGRSGAVRSKSSGPNFIKGRYMIIQKLGSGGMGRVYLAKDLHTNGFIVLKEMYPPDDSHQDREYFQKTFEREAHVLSLLEHPGIPKITDYFLEDNAFYIVMEYVEGENLETILEEKNIEYISIENFIKWMSELISILKYLHNQTPPIIHRDIKPGNVMLDSSNRIFLVDFGVAKSLKVDISAHTQVGTMGYASPEHYSGKFVLSSDIYSLGATFHYLLTGDPAHLRMPFDYPPLSNYRKDIPLGLQEIFSKMLSHDPTKRYQSMEELERDFNEFTDQYKNPRPRAKKDISIIREGSKTVLPPSPEDATLELDKGKKPPTPVFREVKSDYGSVPPSFREEVKAETPPQEKKEEDKLHPVVIKRPVSTTDETSEIVAGGIKARKRADIPTPILGPAQDEKPLTPDKSGDQQPPSFTNAGDKKDNSKKDQGKSPKDKDKKQDQGIKGKIITGILVFLFIIFVIIAVIYFYFPHLMPQIPFLEPSLGKGCSPYWLTFLPVFHLK